MIYIKMYAKYVLVMVLISVFLSGCAFKKVRQQDLNSWKNVSVEELDTHSFFLTLPLIKTKTSNNIEIRVYPNKINLGKCYGSGNIKHGFMNSSDFSMYQNCSSKLVGCDNIFYIKDNKVMEYKPVGRCFTDKRVQPEFKSW